MKARKPALMNPAAESVADCRARSAAGSSATRKPQPPSTSIHSSIEPSWLPQVPVIL